MFNNIPLSLYVHLPWCIKKCPYCDFNSHSIKKNNVFDLYNKYVFHLLNDFDQYLSVIQNRPINTIFIGGGTPSLFNNKSIKLLIDGIKKRVNVSSKTEITIEVNPSTVENKKFLFYKQIGINRISLGIQSFNDHHLKNLGRVHNRKDALRAIKVANNINFNNINIDIMYGLPNQNTKQALDDLYHCIMLNPQHISWYQLTIEPKTIFSRYTPNLPNNKCIWNIFKKGNKLLKSFGYKNYEISSYSKDGYFCKHNINYWVFGDYIGIGAGAHSKLTKNNNILRTCKVINPFHYMKGNYIKYIYKVKSIDKPLEFFINRFRLSQRLLKKDFFLYTGLQPSYVKNQINKAIKQGFLKDSFKYWTTTKKGKLFLNNLLECFID